MMTFPVREGRAGVSRSAFLPYVLLQCEDSLDSDGRASTTRIVMTVHEAEEVIEMLQQQIKMIRRAPGNSLDGATMVDEFEGDPKPLFPPPTPWTWDEKMDVLYVKREGTKIANSSPDDWSSDLVKNLDAEGKVIGLQFIAVTEHEDAWFKSDRMTGPRYTLPKDIVAAVDQFYLAPETEVPEVVKEIAKTMGVSEAKAKKINDMVDTLVVDEKAILAEEKAVERRRSPSFEGGAMVAWMVKPNPEAARDEHERVKKLLGQCRGLLDTGCPNPKADGRNYCSACETEFAEDPDAYK